MMSKSALAVVAFACLLPACGSDGSAGGQPTSGKTPYGGSTEFNPGPVPDGFTRFEVPVVPDIQPGDDKMYCQWIAAPSDAAQNVLEVQGMQGLAGHHAAVYANSKIEPIGTTRECVDDDMVTVTFLGAVGGEGTAGPAVSLPDGMVFQMPAGQAIMANTHYINTTSKPVDGNTVLDVKFADPDPNLIVAGSFAINYLGMQIPPMQTYSVDVTCTVDQKFSFVMFSNHMHRHGTEVFTEVVHADSTTTMISQDHQWTADQAFNPPFVHWTMDAPFVVNAGDMLHERCTWRNETTETIAFPTEMCVGVAYTMEAGAQYICNAAPM
jgi:hypothetical protein